MIDSNPDKAFIRITLNLPLKPTLIVVGGAVVATTGYTWLKNNKPEILAAIKDKTDAIRSTLRKK